MSYWDQRIKDNSIWQDLKSLGEQLSKTEPHDEHTIAGLSRLRTILAFIENRLVSVELSLIPPAPLAEIRSQIQHANGDLRSFQSNRESGSIDEANNRLDIAIAALGSVPVILTDSDFKPLGDAAYEYRNFIERSFHLVRERLVVVDRELEASKRDLLNKKNELDAELQLIRKASSKTLSDLAASADKEQSRLDRIISGHQDSFSSAQDDRQKEFAKSTSGWQSKFESLRTAISATASEQQKRDSEAAALILNEMQKQKDEVIKLVGIIGNTGMTSGFQKAATEAGERAKTFQWITVGSISVLIIWLLMAALRTTSLQWPDLAARILVSVAFGALAAYCGFQGDKYLEIQRKNRKLELELGAVGPYLAPLPETEQHDFRLSLAKLVFGRKDELTLGRGKRSPTTVLDVLTSEDARELIAKITPSLTPDSIKAIGEAISLINKR